MKSRTAVVILLLAALAHAGTVTGKVVTGGGSGIANGTVSFTPSQAGYITGVGALTQTPNYCYTSTDGSIVGLPNPLVLPSGSTNYGAGTLPAATYYVVIGYWVSTTVTLYSPEYTVVMTSTGTLTINAPALQPTGATGYKVYISTTSGTETLQGTVTGWGSYAQATNIAAGAALPSSNTTVCSFSFNDTIIPSYTTYFTDIVDALANHVPGFPQNFYFSGSTVALDTMTPAANLVAKFPTAIIASPSGNASQSINGPLTLNGFNMTAGRFVSTIAIGTAPLVVTSTTPVANLTVQNLNSSTVINTTNPFTLTWSNPSIARSVNFPDPGANGGNVLYDVKGTLDCSVMTCKRSPMVWFVAGACNNTTAAAGFDNFGANAPTPFCVSGTNVVKGVLGFPSAVTWIQENSNSTAAAATVTVTYTAATTTGNLLVAEIAFDATRTITGCTDTTNAYTQAFHSTNGALSVDLWYFNGNSTGKAAASTLTCTFSANAAAAIVWHEYAGSLTAAILDKTATGSGSGTSVATGTTAATTQAVELVIPVVGVLAAAPTIASANGTTQHTVKAQATSVEVNSSGYIQQATGAQSSTFTLGTASTWAAGIATFKANVASAAIAQTQYGLPASFLSATAINASIRYESPQAPTGTANAILGAAVSCTADGATDDPAFNTATTSTTVVPSAIKAVTTLALASLTSTGCTNATAQQLHFQISRQRYTVGDSYEGWIYVNGAGFTYGVSQ